jgi:uncharacterized protein (TIGR00369 family)
MGMTRAGLSSLDMTPGELSTGGLVEALGIEIVEMSEDRVVGTLDAGPKHQQPYGVVHGGTYCAMVETLASIGAALWGMERGLAAVVGVSNTTDFLRLHREGSMVGVATPIHRGRTQQLWAVEVTREGDGKLLARGQLRLQNISDPAAIGA